MAAYAWPLSYSRLCVLRLRVSAHAALVYKRLVASINGMGVDVGGRTIHVTMSGMGSPSVILEAG